MARTADGRYSHGLTRPRDERAHLQLLPQKYAQRDERRRYQKGGAKLTRNLVRTWAIVRELSATSVGRTLRELAGAYGVSPLTIQRDLRSLRAAGFPVVGAYGAGRKYRWRIPLKDFTVRPSPRRRDVRARLARVVQVLRALEQSRAGLTLQQLAGDLGADAVTVRRDLSILEDAGVPLYVDAERWRVLDRAEASR